MSDLTIESIKRAAEILSTDGLPERYYLVGSPWEIALWKDLYGNSVDYIERKPLQVQKDE